MPLNTRIIPGAPAELIARINARAARIPNGMRMSAQTSELGDGADSAEKAADAKDAALGEPGLKALQAEREARQQLERQVAQLAPVKAQMDAVAAAFGVSADAAKGDDLAAEVKAMQEQLAEMTAKAAHARLVSEVVEQHEGLSAADVALVGSLPSRDAMEALAKRLAEGATPGKRIPKPDRSVGLNGSGSSSGGSVSAGRDLYQARHSKKN